MADTKLDRLLSQLNTSGIQTSNNPLYQVIKQLIQILQGFSVSTSAAISSTSSSSAPKNKTYLTENNETSDLPNSRQLLAGTNVSFDDSIAGQRTVNVPNPVIQWDVLTDGDLIEPELIYVGGEVIMLHTP